MKVNIEISEEYVPPYAVIYTDELTDEIRGVMDIISRGGPGTPVLGQKDERIIPLRPEDIFMIRSEGGDPVIYTQSEKYFSNKRLYELLELAGHGFMQISKQCVISLDHVQSVEAGFSGSLLVKLDNGLSDYVSRRYLPAFRKYLGL
ncbi:MAG: LytTR family DNA-binding domain-containing protein [Anaerovoracaceae bacterium]